jgi:hypothetical protein
MWTWVTEMCRIAENALENIYTTFLFLKNVTVILQIYTENYFANYIS